ncbi:MAG: phosphatase PAP2 family protein [Bacteroidetes bacterium]|nr:phosphatase PAP2 family protein [Bacteroidota bacterium]
MAKKISFIFFLFFTGLVSSQNLDLRILKSVNQTDMPCWDKTMKGVSFSVYPMMPASVIGIWAQGYINKDEVMMRNGYKSAVSIAFAVAAASGLKYAVNRTRPYNEYPNDIIKRDNAGPYSFPSGHTTAAFATATALSMSYKKWYVTLPSFAYASFVGYSRMRLGMHYGTDVLGGILIGIGSGLLTWKLDKAFNKK